MATSTFVEPSTIGNPTSVASSASSVQLLAANSARRGYTLYNESTAILYLLNANANASISNYTLQIVAGGYYEMPFAYSGTVNGIWASANGFARIVEHT